MNRVPVSAFRPWNPLRGSKAAAKPSVRRVELYTAPCEMKLTKLCGSDGSGDPAWRQIIFDEKASYKPRSGFPTITWVPLKNTCDDTEELNDSSTPICGAGNALICAASTRRFWMRRFTVPVADSVKLNPL